MDLKKLGQQAKSLVDKRGGSESVKEDADELKDIAKSEGSLADRAKAAVEAIKEPGAADEPAAPVAAEASTAERERAAEKVEGEERGKHAGDKAHGGGHGRHERHGGRREREDGSEDPAV
jgi:hypothetical protein